MQLTPLPLTTYFYYYYFFYYHFFTFLFLFFLFQWWRFNVDFYNFKSQPGNCIGCTLSLDPSIVWYLLINLWNDAVICYDWSVVLVTASFSSHLATRSTEERNLTSRTFKPTTWRLIYRFPPKLRPSLILRNIKKGSNHFYPLTSLCNNPNPHSPFISKTPFIT